MSYAQTARMSRRIQPRVASSTPSGAPAGRSGATRPRRATNPSSPTYTAPKTVAAQVVEPDPRLGLGERPDSGENDPDRQEQGRLVGEQRRRRRDERDRRREHDPEPDLGLVAGGIEEPERLPGGRRPRARSARGRSRACRGAGRRGSGGTKTSALIARWRTVGDPGSATEAARPPGELRKSRIEGIRAEVGPQDIAHVELGVGRLPDEEVREALLAAGPDDQVGIGQAGRVERGRDRRFVDGLGWREEPGEPALLYVDLHLVHEVTSPQAFDGLRLAGRGVRRPERTVATMDHNVPTTDGPIAGRHGARASSTPCAANCAEFGIELHATGSGSEGIVHVIGPELGLTQPGQTIVCGDSHTSTHGAFGALAFGIGTSEVEHVLATQTLPQRRPRTMLVEFDGLAAARAHGEGRDPRRDRPAGCVRRCRPRRRVRR